LVKNKLNIGFVSTRLAGIDGVSLEVDKWVEVLQELGHESFCFCGKTDWPSERTLLVEESYFKHPEIESINTELFIKKQRSQKIADSITKLAAHIKKGLYKFVQKFDIDLLVVENAWSLPMNIPLGIALSEFVGETVIPAIAHHHDFWWDRQRYLGSPTDDYLGAAFPSSHSGIQHVVINSIDRRQLSYRKGVSAAMIPNVMNFEVKISSSDNYADDLRKELGINDDVKLLLQPTRVVPRKKIERAIELARRINDECVIVVTHETGDEGMSYNKYLREFADFLEIKIIFASDRFNQSRGALPDGRKIYSMADAYKACDLVTYTSQIEGFGNAFLESIYYKKPIVIGAYEIFKLDIQPHGFKVIQLDDFISEEAVEKVNKVLSSPEKVNIWAENNYHLGSLHYSYETLKNRLKILLEEPFGLMR
jgi:glycosyltransferase involved in cell wall biosynthesis